jgi:hypothetical protein
LFLEKQPFGMTNWFYIHKTTYSPSSTTNKRQATLHLHISIHTNWKTVFCVSQKTAYFRINIRIQRQATLHSLPRPRVSPIGSPILISFQTRKAQNQKSHIDPPTKNPPNWRQPVCHPVCPLDTAHPLWYTCISSGEVNPLNNPDTLTDNDRLSHS